MTSKMPSRSMNKAKQTIPSIYVTFLGTASAQPSSTRNHSSLALRIDGDVWLFDCGEGTQRQIQRSSVKMGKIRKIFVTHTHGDHIFGLAPLLASCLNGAGGIVDGAEVDSRAAARASSETNEPIEIFGPLGTRAYIRASLTYTHTLLEGNYVVHELRFLSDPKHDRDLPPHLQLHSKEFPTGRNIVQSSGVWHNLYTDEHERISVSAAPIEHSVPCVGYVIREAPVPSRMDPKEYVPHIKRVNAPMSLLSEIQAGRDVILEDGTVLKGLSRRPGRLMVILGDTCDPSDIAKLLGDGENPDILIHESTNAYLPHLDTSAKADDTVQSVEERAKSRGHSTPQMAGSFAKRIGAKKLILNHFSARYRGDDDINEEANKVMDGIKMLAAEGYNGDIVCARDFMTVDVELPDL